MIPTFPLCVRFFSVDLKEQLIPRTAIVTGEGTPFVVDDKQSYPTLNLQVFMRQHEDQRLKGESAMKAVLNVPYFETVPEACEQHEVKNTRFYPDGKRIFAAFCCSKFDPKAKVPDIGQGAKKTTPAKADDPPKTPDDPKNKDPEQQKK